MSRSVLYQFSLYRMFLYYLQSTLMFFDVQILRHLLLTAIAMIGSGCFRKKWRDIVYDVTVFLNVFCLDIRIGQIFQGAICYTPE